jgi:fructose-bisphosphate aldolase class II
MTVTLRQILKRAKQAGYAVAAFNVTNLETAQAAVGAAIKQRSPVIISLSESAARYGGRPLFAAVRVLADEAPVPIVIHLDHHTDFELIKAGLSWGASSVMFDGSLLPLAGNIVQTRRAVRLARRFGASTEGEVGTIGGQEEAGSQAVCLAVAGEAARFVRATKVDALALGLGTSHGLPVPHETIHLNILDEYYHLTTTPVVLHGASNLPVATIRAGIRHGVTKINIDTQLRQIFTATVREVLTNDEDCINPRDYLAPARQAMQSEAAQLLKRFGSVNEAHALRRNR